MKRVEDEAKARMRPGTDVGGWGVGRGDSAFGYSSPRWQKKEEGLFEVIGFSLFSEDSELEPV